MNKQILEHALDLMASNDEFDMAAITHGAGNCDTPACIAGHILAAAGALEDPDVAMPDWGDNDLCEMARGLAEISLEEESQLFLPQPDDGCDYDCDVHPGEDGYITREHAVRCLRKFIDTGVVDWNGTAEEE